MLIRIIKNWTYPDLFLQTPDGNGVWEDIHFTLEPVGECDALIILNELREDITISCPPANIWSVFQEPYYPGFFPWLNERHTQFARVYTHHPPHDNRRYRVSQPLVPWHVGKSYGELVSTNISQHDKSERIAWITSSSLELPGHLKRKAFCRFLMDARWPDLDVWGRGIRPIESKWDVLVHRRYAIAIENQYSAHYWTEKIADCWLAETLPFYYGCPNLEKYFPADSFVRIDLADFGSAARIIRRMVDSGEYERRLPAIREARDLVLNRHQFFPFLTQELRAVRSKVPATTIRLSAYRQGLLSRFRCFYSQKLHQHNVDSLVE